MSVLGLAALALATLVLVTSGASSSAASAVNLGTAGSYGVLAGSAVTNSGDSVISGDLGVSPGTAVSGFPPGLVLGTIHKGDEVVAQAQTDLTTAYNAVASQALTQLISADLGGSTLTSGVYRATESLGLTGELTLDAKGDAGAVFIFQAGSTLTTASGSMVTLVNGAQSCNVYWQIGSSATLGSHSAFRGTVLALTSITAGTGATVAGRLLARNGAVTLLDNTITPSSCSTVPPTDIPPTDIPPTDIPPTDIPPTDIPPTDIPPTDIPPTDIPPTDIPPTDIPPTDIPPTDIPPTDIPPTDIPPTDIPPTDIPPTYIPPTDIPPTDIPPTDIPPTDIPPNEIPPVIVPPEVVPPEVVPPEVVPPVSEVTPPTTSSLTPQVSTIPKGVPDTGDGGSASGSSYGLVWAGGLLLCLAGAALIGRRRKDSAD